MLSIIGATRSMRESANWVVEPRTFGSRTLTARTSDKQLKSVVPVWNLTDEDFLHRKGMLLGDAEEASRCEGSLDGGLEKKNTRGSRL